MEKLWVKRKEGTSPCVSVISTTSVVEKTAKLSETLGTHTEKFSALFAKSSNILMSKICDHVDLSSSY